MHIPYMPYAVHMAIYGHMLANLCHKLAVVMHPRPPLRVQAGKGPKTLDPKLDGKLSIVFENFKFCFERTKNIRVAPVDGCLSVSHTRCSDVA